MSRKDTIIISVLINAGLLAILFATAWRADDDIVSNTIDVQAAIVEAGQPQQPIKNSTGAIDEVDSVIQQATPVAAMTQQRPKPATTAPVATIASATDIVEVTVKRGDYLDKIARANGTTVAAIMKANGLKDVRLQIGQVLKVPKGQKQSPPAQPTTTEIASADIEYYTVARGDSPWTIARKCDIKLSELLRLNDLDEDKARNLREGDKLKIR